MQWWVPVCAVAAPQPPPTSVVPETPPPRAILNPRGTPAASSITMSVLGFGGMLTEGGSVGPTGAEEAAPNESEGGEEEEDDAPPPKKRRRSVPRAPMRVSAPGGGSTKVRPPEGVHNGFLWSAMGADRPASQAQDEASASPDVARGGRPRQAGAQPQQQEDVGAGQRGARPHGRGRRRRGGGVVAAGEFLWLVLSVPPHLKAGGGVRARPRRSRAACGTAGASLAPERMWRREAKGKRQSHGCGGGAQRVQRGWRARDMQAEHCKESKVMTPRWRVSCWSPWRTPREPKPYFFLRYVGNKGTKTSRGRRLTCV